MYHGRILLPPEYPFKPPHIVMLTPTGRFEINTKVCLSFSAFHPELWQPAWGIRLILEALISFLPTPADGAVGALDWSATERKKLAKQSVHFECPVCGKVKELLPQLKPKEEIKDGSNNTDDSSNNKTKTKNRFQKEIEKLQRLQMSNHRKEIDQEETEQEAGKTEAKVEEQSTKESAKMETAVQDSNETGQAKHEENSSDPLLIPEPPAVPAGRTEVTPTLSTDNVRDANEKGSTSVNKEAKSPNKPESAVVNESEPNVPVPEQVPDVQQQERQQQQQQPAQQNEPRTTSLMDPILQGIILLLSVICFLLLRKVQVLMEDLNALQ